MTIKDLNPSLIWNIFDQITQVPRPSKKEEKMREFLINFAKQHGVEYKTDAIGNVAMFRKASKGHENAPRVILQGHMDMVCVANDGVNHDFDNDPITTIIDGEWVHADGTTLGADNGIGVAAGLAVMIDKDLVTGPVQALFTVDEEVSMTGANNLGEGMIEGDIVLNLDSEEDGEICMGCAGGIGTTATFAFTPTPAPADYKYIDILFKDFQGGHSGTDIDAERACANKLIMRFVWNTMAKRDVKLAHVDTGDKHNAIAVKANVVIGVKPQDLDDTINELNQFAQVIKNEYKHTEKDMKVLSSVIDAPQTVIDDATAKKLVAAVYCAPHGVYHMSKEIEGLVETSTNLASIKIKGNDIVVETLQRSSVESRKIEMSQIVEAHFALAGATITHSDPYPGWAPNMDSPILNIAIDTYSRLFGSKPKTSALHAGLETGLFLINYPHLDMISFGPTLRGVHSPKEKMHIPAVEKFWNFLTAMLSDIANK
ncbi:MAG: aminoacyl-histidine dipeptidase [Muribaculaceae bacterium]